MQNSIFQNFLIVFNYYMLLESDNIECLIIQINEVISVEQANAFCETRLICYVSD